MPSDHMQIESGFAERVHASFERQGLMAHLGAELTAIGKGTAEIRVRFRPELSQQHNYFHAGVTGAIVDSACGYAAYSLMPADASVLTVEYKLNLLAPANGLSCVQAARWSFAAAMCTSLKVARNASAPLRFQRLWRCPPWPAGARGRFSRKTFRRSQASLRVCSKPRS